MTSDLHRELTKIRDALTWAERTLTKQNEANAALHCTERVLYQPLTTTVIAARVSLDHILEADNTADTSDSHARQLAGILIDLDRCDHGRHAADACGECGGQSDGNLYLSVGQIIGTNLYGEPISVPPVNDRRDPGAWYKPRR